MEDRHSDAPQRMKPEEIEEEEKLPKPPLYTGERKRMRGSGFSNSGVMPFVITAIVVLLISYFVIVPQVAVTKKDFTTNMGTVATDIKALQDSNKIMGPKLDAVNGNMTVFGATINTQKTQLDALTAQITDLKNQIAATNNNINNLQASINNNFVAKSGLEATIKGVVNTADLQKSIDADKATLAALNTQLVNTNKSITDLKTALEARIVALEAKTTTTSSSGVSQTNLPFTYAVSLIDEDSNTGSDNRSSSSIKITLTNTTAKAIEDIGIEFLVMVDATEDIIVQPTIEALAGWRVSEWHSNYFVLKGTRITLVASGQYKKIINATVQFAGTADVSSEIDKGSIEITNWDYK